MRVLAIEGLDVRDRVCRMYREAYARPPSDAELRAALHFLESHAAELGVPLDRWVIDERVWSDFAHVLFNVKEFIFLK